MHQNQKVGELYLHMTPMEPSVRLTLLLERLSMRWKSREVGLLL